MMSGGRRFNPTRFFFIILEIAYLTIGISILKSSYFAPITSLREIKLVYEYYHNFIMEEVSRPAEPQHAPSRLVFRQPSSALQLVEQYHLS